MVGWGDDMGVGSGEYFPVSHVFRLIGLEKSVSSYFFLEDSDRKSSAIT